MEKYLRNRPSFYFSFRNPISTLTEEKAPRKAACKHIELDFKTVLVLACLCSLCSYFGQHSPFLRISQIELQEGDFFTHTHTLMHCRNISGTFKEPDFSGAGDTIEGIKNYRQCIHISMAPILNSTELCETLTLDQIRKIFWINKVRKLGWQSKDYLKIQSSTNCFQ